MGRELDLRTGRLGAITAYAHHGRLRDGTTEDMLEAAYAAWIRDQTNGLATILITESTETMHALNARARAQRILTGKTSASRQVTLSSGEPASAGDLIVTDATIAASEICAAAGYATATAGASTRSTRTAASLPPV